MGRFQDLMRAHKRFTFGLWILVLAGLVAGVQWRLGGGKPIRTEVLGATSKATPAPTITSGPSAGSVTSSTSATFTYSDSEKGVTFQCARDGAALGACPTNGISYSGLAEGNHTFRVAAQGVSLSPMTSRTWTVDLTPPPAPAITQMPDNPSFDTKPHFAYSDEAGVTFQCQLDTAAAASCGSSVDYNKPGLGDHTFTVWALDVAGNRSAPASYGWTLLENKAFGITDAVGSTYRQALYPGGSSPVDLLLSNPYNFTIRVTGITVTATAAVKATHQDPRCSVMTDVSTSGLITRKPATAPTVDIPANSSRTLSSYLAVGQAWPADWPRITMVNTTSNQDDCKNTSFTLAYSGTATKP